jgi:hypothetical protein
MPVSLATIINITFERMSIIAILKDNYLYSIMVFPEGNISPNQAYFNEIFALRFAA